MFPEGADPIGDMQCVFAVKSTIPFLVESKKFPVNFSEHLYFTDDEIGEYINVPSRLRKDFEASIFLKRMEVSEMGGLTVYRISSNDYPEMKVILDLLEIPSVVLDYKYVEDGYHKTVFTFHHSHLKEVSRFILQARKKLGHAVPEYLGPNRGIDFTIEKASRMEKVMAGILSATTPARESDQLKALFSSKWVRRPRFGSGSIRNDFIYRIRDTSTLDRKTFKDISGTDGIYRAPTVSEVSLFYTKLLFEHYNPMIYQYHEYDGKNLMICGLVTESYIKIMMEIISKAAEKFSNLDIGITYVADVSPQQHALH